jgi:hypothetical protein
MTARGGGPTSTELRNIMGPRGVPTCPLGIAERWHRNLPSLAKEHTPVCLAAGSTPACGHGVAYASHEFPHSQLHARRMLCTAAGAQVLRRTACQPAEAACGRRAHITSTAPISLPVGLATASRSKAMKVLLGWYSHFHIYPMYISLVVLHTKQTGRGVGGYENC